MFLIPNVGTIIWSTIIFLVVLFILTKFAWKPLLKAINEREEKIETDLNNAKQAKLTLTQLEDDQKAVVESARKEKETLIKEGNEQRDKIIAEAKTKAQVTVDKMLADAERRIHQEREAALVEMKSQLAELSIEIATKVVGAELEDKQRHEKLVEGLVKDIELN